jgi:hypothetical protein
MKTLASNIDRKRRLQKTEGYNKLAVEKISPGTMRMVSSIDKGNDAAKIFASRWPEPLTAIMGFTLKDHPPLNVQSTGLLLVFAAVRHRG